MTPDFLAAEMAKRARRVIRWTLGVAALAGAAFIVSPMIVGLIALAVAGALLALAAHAFRSAE